MDSDRCGDRDRMDRVIDVEIEIEWMEGYIWR